MPDINQLLAEQSAAIKALTSAENALVQAQIKTKNARTASILAQDAYSTALLEQSNAADNLSTAQAILAQYQNDPNSTPEEIQDAQNLVNVAEKILIDAQAAVKSTSNQLDIAQSQLNAAQIEEYNAQIAANAADVNLSRINRQITIEQTSLDARSTNAAQGQTAQAAVNTINPPLDNGNLAGPPNSGISQNDYISGSKKSLSGSLSGLDPSRTRLQAAGLYSGGATSGTAPGATGINFASSTVSNEQDWRVRISLADPKIFAESPADVQAVLSRTNGVVFPYTPSITVAHNARYSEQGLVHSNYKSYFYEGSDVQSMTIQGEFTVQNLDDGRYLLAAIYFFRSATKMFWGKDTHANNPPPLVFLDGYGEFYFPHVSCVVMNFTHTLPPDVDYVQIPVTAGGSIQQISTYSGQTVRLPTSSSISVTLQPVYSRRNIYTNFSLTEFAKGNLLKGKGGFL